jgi:carbon catabolite-derepressing protein kinase
MSDSESDLPEIYPASKLGEYTVLRDVAEGTFGKVKSESVELRSRTADPSL